MSEEEEYCRDCKAAPGAFDQGRGIFLYDDRMKYSIMKYKYFGCREYSRFYGRALYLYGRDQLALWKPDVIVPVPLHWRKLRKRGFNQAELLAEELAKSAGIPVDVSLLKKSRATQVPEEAGCGRTQEESEESFPGCGKSIGNAYFAD